MPRYHIVKAYSTDELIDVFGDQDVIELIRMLDEFVRPMGYNVVSGYNKNRYHYVVEHRND
jgi:hypothetical protein